ncbi:hypothetical protein MASR2M117_01940 [Paludibacter sp.]
MKSFSKLILSLVLISFFSSYAIAEGTSNSKDNLASKNEEIHELTVFVVPTKYTLDWSTPSTICKTMRKCYVKSMGLKINYLLGHVALRINTPLLPEPLYFAQTSLSTPEKTKLILKDKVGFGIMGHTLSGGIEPHESLAAKLPHYAGKNMLTFIKFRITKEAAQRVLDFYTEYSRKLEDGHASCNYYGGHFWPRYEQEGGACSTFGMSVLDLINLLDEEYTRVWKVQRKIPMELIGGKLNNGKKVKTSTIKKTHHWYEGDGKVNVDYAPYFVFEPNVIFDWILKKREANSSEYLPIVENGVPGLYFDATDVKVDVNAPLFLERPQTNIFIDYHRKRTNFTPKMVSSNN